MGNRIDVPLELADFEVTSSEVVNGVLEVEVRSSRRPACHHCGSVSVTGHGTNIRRIRDRACAYPTVLLWRQRRLRCNDCDATFRERHPEIAGRRNITLRLRRRLFERACHEPFTDVAVGERVSCYRVLEAFDFHAAEEALRPLPRPPRVGRMDESSFRKRHRYHTIFSDPEQGITFDLAAGRTMGSALEGFLRMDDRLRAGIETVVIDCHWPYRRAIEEALPKARIVADKFHVIRAVDAAAQRVRARLGKRRYRQRIGHAGGVGRQHHPANKPTIFRARWLFMKRATKLSEAERGRLSAVFEASVDELRRAWVLKEGSCSRRSTTHQTAWRQSGCSTSGSMPPHAPASPSSSTRGARCSVERGDPQLLRRSRHQCLCGGHHEQDQGHEKALLRLPHRPALSSEGPVGVRSPRNRAKRRAP